MRDHASRTSGCVVHANQGLRTGARKLTVAKFGLHAVNMQEEQISIHINKYNIQFYLCVSSHNTYTKNGKCI